MASLPTPGADDDTWGTQLNTFLEVAHNSDGTLESAAVAAALGTSGVVAGTYGSSAAVPQVTVNAEGLVTTVADVTISDTYVPMAAVGAANGVTPLDSNELVPVANLPIASQSLLLAGVGAPSNSLGLNGDYYQDIVAGNIYGPKTSGAWPLPPVATVQYVTLPPILGMTAWYDASQITGIGDGASLSSWSDLSGNAHTLTQATGADQPTFYKTTTAKLINGRPAVWFNGSSDFMQAVAFGTALAQPTTLFVVAQFQGTPASGAYIVFDGVTDVQRIFINTDQWCLNAGSTAASGTPDTNLHVLMGQFNGASSILGVDAAQYGSLSPGTDTLDRITVGSQGSGAPTALWNGPVCEILLYPSALNAESITAVYTYLNNKWG